MMKCDASALSAMIAQIFESAGSQSAEAAIIADHLVESNLVGHESHGVVRVHKYVDWREAGEVIPNRHAELVSERGAVALLDGRFGYGQVIGLEAMQLLADRTRAQGFGAVAIRNSGHLGRIGAWAEMLAADGFVSVHFVNTSGYGILVAPHGGSDRRLSANPVAAGAPRPNGPPIVLDVATSTIAEGKIQVARNQGKRLPENAVLDGRGAATTDPETFYADPPGAIFPFGGHKGSGLSFFCEILAGCLTGGFASNPEAPTANRLVNNMLSIAFDPESLAGQSFFDEDMSRLTEWTKASPPIVPGGGVLLPGEIEAKVRAERTANGIPIDAESWEQLVGTARRLGIDPSVYFK